MDTRFYSFVAGLYLSPLQCGLQTAHAVSEMYSLHSPYSGSNDYMSLYDQWARVDKTIIILNAMNSRGVVNAHLTLQEFAKRFKLPLALFHEDSDSLNGAATACAIIVPQKFYDAEFCKGDPNDPDAGGYYVYTDPNVNSISVYDRHSPEFGLCFLIKSYRLV